MATPKGTIFHNGRLYHVVTGKHLTDTDEIFDVAEEFSKRSASDLEKLSREAKQRLRAAATPATEAREAAKPKFHEPERKGMAEAMGLEASDGRGTIKLEKFLHGDDVAEASAHARDVGKVTGVVDRPGTKARRAERMRGYEKVPGKDLDEFPPAVIKPDDPTKVSVRPIDRTHNRRSGGRLRHELPPDGTRVEIDP